MPLLPPAAAPGTYQIGCRACRRITDCSAVEVRTYIVVGPPHCCGQPMRLLNSSADGDQVDRRRSVRLPPRTGLRVEVRRIGVETGDDLGAAITDVSDSGAGFRLAHAVLPGEELEITIIRVTTRKTIQMSAVARWCRPLGGGRFAAGVEFRQRLTASELAALV